VVVDADGLFLVAVSCCSTMFLQYSDKQGRESWTTSLTQGGRCALVVCVERPFGHHGLARHAPGRLDAEHHGVQAVMREDG
jgi:hypothetical protein